MSADQLEYLAERIATYHPRLIKSLVSHEVYGQMDAIHEKLNAVVKFDNSNGEWVPF